MVSADPRSHDLRSVELFLNRALGTLPQLCELLFYRAQLANGLLVGEQTLELERDVARCVLVAVERKHAVSLCAAPQPPYSHLCLSHRFLHFLPSTARMQASVACLARVGFRRERYNKALGKLTHEPYPNARRVALVARRTGASSHGSPHAIGKDKGTTVSLKLCLDVSIQHLFALLELDVTLPPSPTVL